jgi:hypothetical protein
MDPRTKKLRVMAEVTNNLTDKVGLRQRNLKDMAVAARPKIDEKPSAKIPVKSPKPTASPLMQVADRFGTLTETQQNILLVLVMAPSVAVILYRWQAQGVF